MGYAVPVPPLRSCGKPFFPKAQRPRKGESMLDHLRCRGTDDTMRTSWLPSPAIQRKTGRCGKEREEKLRRRNKGRKRGREDER